jgi:hypothetical protein
MDEFLRWTKRQPSNDLDVAFAVDIEVDHRIMGACCADVMAADVTTNISGVLDKAAAIEAVVAEEADEEGPTIRFKERKETRKHNRHSRDSRWFAFSPERAWQMLINFRNRM